MQRMKKKRLLSITIILIFIISALGILLIQNNPIIPPLNTPSHLNPIAKAYTGNGNTLNATLQVVNDTNSTGIPTDTINDFTIECPVNWNITYANITLTNIIAPNATIISTELPNNDSWSIATPMAMSFQITNPTAYLDNASLLLNIQTPGNAVFRVFNAQDNGSGVPKPFQQIGLSVTEYLVFGVSWINISFNHRLLNCSETFSNTFFITAEKLGPLEPLVGSWLSVGGLNYAADGYAYQYNSSSANWDPTTYPVDFKLNVNVSASSSPNPESVFPSEITLKINATNVENMGNKGEGRYILTTPVLSSTGVIYFDITSTWMQVVTLTVDFRNISYAKNITANTNFIVNYNTAAFWNITVNADDGDGFPETNGANYIKITGIPPDWGNDSSMAYNGTSGVWITLNSTPPNDIIFPASNGTWIVNCTAPNYVLDIGFAVDGEPVENATLFDLLDINVTFNTSLRSNVTGSVTLNIYDFSQILNYTDGKSVNQVTGTSLSWDVDSTATSTGTYNVTVSFHDGFVVGYNESQLDVVALTSSQLDVTWYPEHYEYPGPVPVTIHYYNKTNLGQGIAGASISSYFENHTPITIPTPTDYGNGSYRVELNFGTAFDVHSVYFRASKRLFEPSNSSTISVNYTKVLVSITLETPQSVVLNTPLVAAATLRYYTNGSVFVGQNVNFNFSLRFANGSSTVIQRTSLTNDEGRAEASIVVPLDTVELKVTAFYSGTGTVSGVASSTNSVTLTSAAIDPMFMGLLSLMFLVVAKQSQNFTFYLLIGSLVGSVAVAGVGMDRVRRRRLVPLRALASLENIIVDHITTGATLWSFDFLKMEQDVTLVSGFMSAVKSFMGEMQKGGLRKLETELGTFIREDGDFLTATCITCGNTPQEEEWLRRKLRSFLAEAETQHMDLLQDWRGDVQPFRDSLPLILASVIDLDKAEKLLRERISKLQKSKEKLQTELNRLGSQLEDLARQLESGKITESKFEEEKAKIEPKYDEVQKEYIHTSLCLSRVPPSLEAKKPTPEVAKEVEKIQDRFLRIRMEIEGLRRKEQDGTITQQDIKRRDKLHKELLKLIERLDKLQK
ncbi:MAG: hypothetical protein KIH08_00865 [Candidatus Freyarchaeota archaeon]|nr:hypothetical protein [Candidatus Jordarchaeia archaeon]MBS7268106.1 hypothetical protein [Candidatus Jordarchaeia archaeon]MBS7278991.1 hypothetical protein [Candidatus Jordarchaeia archaeon]